jgi:hypothetical protein
MPSPPQEYTPRRNRFKAGHMGTHTGVKFKLASGNLQRRKKLEQKEADRAAKRQHQRRLLLTL